MHASHLPCIVVPTECALVGLQGQTRYVEAMQLQKDKA